MPPGSDYEKFVQRLQQAILNSAQYSVQQNIEVQRNRVIKDSHGVFREFDLYWEYALGGLTYKTVIECKDYSSRVSIDKVDALLGKVRDIPDLKPVFATKLGYQSGARIKAQANGIELLVVREQHEDDWRDQEGNPIFREVSIDINLSQSARITKFEPTVDRRWLAENTSLSPQQLSFASGLNNQIFIEDLDMNDRYSLLDLAGRLDSLSGDNYGELSHQQSFKNAYLVYGTKRLKMTSYQANYIRPMPVETNLSLDFSKELIGVVEYLNKNSTTVVFTQGVIEDWK